ncbi:hypothetical protein GLYMA_13G158100v4 [Glycine max]|uniref:Uncharacterized protein n=1 Tax=Glycine max TaxID=3847 RepID=A0A0R0H0Q1_SOYBN|nr:hypothetical protein GYH30_036368 [Glycine max]KRH20127.1 hypothetical protein GLYMA_13G158100v4 [Glycine max]
MMVVGWATVSHICGFLNQLWLVWKLYIVLFSLYSLVISQLPNVCRCNMQVLNFVFLTLFNMSGIFQLIKVIKLN